MNTITLPHLTKTSAAKLAAEWPWCQSYWTTRHADAKALWDAAQQTKYGIAFRELDHPTTRQHGWLLIRVE